MSERPSMDEALSQLPEELRAKLREAMERSFPAEGHEPDRDDAYEQLRVRAAVTGAFDPTRIVPQDFPPERQSALLDRLLSESTVAMHGGRRMWILNAGPRKDVLKELSPDRVREAARGVGSEDELSRSLQAYLSGSAKPLDQQSSEELVKSAIVTEWLEGTQFEAPSAADVQQQLGFAQLLRPMKELADTFVGRTDELRQLRDYVGVQPAESWAGWGRRRLQAVKRSVKRWASFQPFLVHGAGGIGKSTLIAAFLMEHAKQEPERRFPFAYLDFDRATLQPRQPLSLLNEIARQIAFQFPELRELATYADVQRTRLERQLLEYRRHQQASVSGADDSHVGRDTRLVGDAAAELRRALVPLTEGTRPFLVVIDTFEEVQCAGSDDVGEVLRLLRLLSDEGKWDALRVVIAGRAPLEETPVAGEIALGELDEPAALEFLRRRDVSDPAVAKEILEHVGGSPLALKLAAEIVKQERSAVAGGEVSVGDLVGVERKIVDKVLGRYDSEHIAVQLYSRVLGHIRDDEVRALAHPGLVLRRITADLILQVLAGPCKLKDVTEQRARDLLERLARQVALVKRTDGQVVHRRDIRKRMLPLIRDDLARHAPGTFEEINAKAAAYYGERTEPEARAEELYHRLLGGDLGAAEQRWSTAAEPLLQGAVDDLTGAARALLRAKLGRTLSAAELQHLGPSAWTEYVWRQGMSEIAEGEPVKAEALLESRADEPADPRFALLRGSAMRDQGRVKAAVAAFERGLHWGGPLADRFALARAFADLLLTTGDGRAAQLFAEGASMARDLRVPLAELECLTGQLGAERRLGSTMSETVYRVLEAARSQESLLVSSPGLLRRLVLFLPAEPSRAWLARYFRAHPPRSLNRHELEIFGQLLRLAHVQSRDAGGLLEQPGAVRVMKSASELFAMEEMGSSVARALNALLVRDEPASDEEVELAKGLLVTRHFEWRVAARHGLLADAKLGLQKLARRFLPDHRREGFSTLPREAMARELVDHADDCGRLVELLEEAARTAEGRQLANVLAGWDRFLRSLAGARTPRAPTRA